MSDNFGINLKRLRKAMGLTQAELAKKLGLQKTTISNYETSFSSPPKNALVKIAQFFDVTLDELLGTFSKSPSPVSVGISLHETGTKEQFIKIFSTVSSVKDILGTKNLVDTVGFSKNIIAENCFGLVMADDSLSQKGIRFGDYVIFIFSQIANNGDIVAASINGAPAIIGSYHETKNEVGFIPFSQNPEYTAKFYPKKDNSVTILGKAIKAFVNVK